MLHSKSLFSYLFHKYNIYSKVKVLELFVFIFFTDGRIGIIILLFHVQYVCEIYSVSGSYEPLECLLNLVLPSSYCHTKCKSSFSPDGRNTFLLASPSQTTTA